MKEHVTKLEYHGKELILIATAHVSPESVALVKEVIEEEHPSSVCIELDQQRYQNLQNPKAWEQTDVVQVIKSGQAGFLLANLALSSFQRKIAKNLDAKVGGEMIQGIQSAQEVGAQLVLADRSIQTTFLRIWRKLGLWEKGKLLFHLIFSFGEDDDEITAESLQELMQQDMLEAALADMRKEFPKIGEILVSERDQYLAHHIKNAPGPKVVAVLGGAHLPGVQQEIFREQDVAELATVPPKSSSSKAAGWILPAIIVGIIVYGFFRGGAQMGLRQIASWVLWNGTLAALGTALCLGHPLSALTAFLVAPISSLNPFMACGWFAGLVEASLRKPTVQDIQQVPVDMQSVKGLLRNRFLRILLIVVMANLGSTIGTFVAGTDMIRNLF